MMRDGLKEMLAGSGEITKIVAGQSLGVMRNRESLPGLLASTNLYQLLGQRQRRSMLAPGKRRAR